MVEMMRDVTYGTTFWETKPDIINRVLAILNSFDVNWDMLSAAVHRWTSSRYSTDLGYYYSGGYGLMTSTAVYNNCIASPVTIYEF